MQTMFLTRRQFVTRLALATAVAGVSRVQARLLNAPEGPELLIEEASVNITGRARRATLAGGSLPGPTLRFREGDTVRIRVTNHLRESTSIHWHGLQLPESQDGTPGLTFAGIAPGESFTYEFPLIQSGTYFYHSHSGAQEATGLFGALIIEPAGAAAYASEREHIVLLSDWSDETPAHILSNIKGESDYYNLHRQSLVELAREAKRTSLREALDERAMWGGMRMSATDISDVSGATYTYLINGQSPAANLQCHYEAGERVRLRLINAAAMTIFDVRIPGLTLQVIAADGQDVEAVQVDELRIYPGESYDVLVRPQGAAYLIFAQALDRSGFARATLTPDASLIAPTQALDAPPTRTMSDMGMGAMGEPGIAGALHTSVLVDHVNESPIARLGEPGTGLEDNGRRVLTYQDLVALEPDTETQPVAREVTFHLTGNMARYDWSFDGVPAHTADPVRLALNERVRFTLINDTMMEHPIHLHGYLFRLENGTKSAPLKHTVLVKPNERLSLLFTARHPGHWAFHCHLLYHMMGMFRTVLVA